MTNVLFQRLPPPDPAGRSNATAVGPARVAPPDVDRDHEPVPAVRALCWSGGAPSWPPPWGSLALLITHRDQ